VKIVMVIENRIQNQGKQAFQFLKQAYELTRLNRRRFNALEVGTILGLSRRKSLDVIDYLASRGLIRHDPGSDTCSFSHRGLDEIEWSLSHPGYPLES
jgi:hypothetical protein